MKINTIITTIAATLLFAGIVPASSAQDSYTTQDGIEVITIIGKRPALTAAAPCANAETARTDVLSIGKPDHGSEQALDAGKAGTNGAQRDIKPCSEQAVPVKAQI